MTIGQRLKKARKRLKKTQAQIAGEVGVEQATVSYWESDKAVPRSNIVQAAAAAYDLDPVLLLPEAA